MGPSISTSGQRGASAVEMAILLPVILVLLFAIIDYGRFFFLRASLTAAVTDGARTAILPGATSALVQTVVARALQDPINQGAGAAPVVVMSPTDPVEGSPVSVTASVPFTPLVLPNLVGSVLFPSTLSATATMTVEP